MQTYPSVGGQTPSPYSMQGASFYNPPTAQPSPYTVIPQTFSMSSKYTLYFEFFVGANSMTEIIIVSTQGVVVSVNVERLQNGLAC